MSVARVLVIEDEANNLDVAQRIIRAAGHEALVATDGQSGLDIARAEHPDAILVDLLLPLVDGWTVTRTLRGEAWAARIPIIAVSALAMQRTASARSMRDATTSSPSRMRRPSCARCSRASYLRTPR